MWRTFRSLHGLLEKLATRTYRKGAYQLGAESVKWKSLDVTSNSSAMPKIIAALDSLDSTAAVFSDLIQNNIKSIISAQGIATRTLPVTKTFLVDSAVASGIETKQLAYAFVQSAAYIDFYAHRLFFLPALFFRKRDRLARSEAKRIATAFRTQTEGLWDE
jgi:hypothetical protein